MGIKQAKDFSESYRKLTKLLVLVNHKNMTDKELEDLLDMLMDISEQIGEIVAREKIDVFMSDEDK